VIPMKCADTDSIAAFMALYGTPQGVWYRMYGREPASPAGGTLEDLFMHYQSSLFGNGATRSKRTVPFSAPKGQPGYVVEVTTCWEVYTSLDGGRSWEYQYTACNTASTWIGGGGYTPEGTSLGGGYTGGGGGGTTGGGTDNTDAPTLAGISPRAILAVYNLRDRLVQAYCPNARIFEAEWNSGLTIRINPALPSGHLGRCGPNTIEFRSLADITDQSLLHELFHQYQDTHYGSYSATQYGEFETWLLVDLYLFFNNKALTWTKQTNNTALQEDYDDWLKLIEENGINSTTLKDYPYWFNQFMEAMKNTEYKNYPVGTHTQPDAIRQTFQLCNFNQ